MHQRLIVAATLGFAAVMLTPAQTIAQTMNLREFVTVANGIPRNPTALLRSDFRRVKREFEGGLTAVNREEQAAKAAGRRPSMCPPERMTIDAIDTLRRLDAIAQAGRPSMTITDGVRQMLRDRYPCPA
jgi:hypothetical protein